MFGHHNDVITQDQNTDADVAIPDDAMAAMATSPAQDQPQSPTDQVSNQAVPQDEFQPAPDQSQSQSAPGFSNMTTSAPVVDNTASNDQSSDDSAPILSGFMQPAAAEPDAAEPDAVAQPTQDDTPVADQPDDNVQAQDQPQQVAEPETPVSEPTEIEEPKLLIDEEESHQSSPKPELPHEDTAASNTVQSDTPDTEDLLHIKQDALEQLSPLVDQLEQEPEQKFRTLLMLIQASDNRTLLSHAYKVALQIEDEKVRAQALLDVVNEINYFTHDNGNSAHPDSSIE